MGSSAEERLVVFKGNEPAAVILNVHVCQEMLDELENLRVDATVRERLANFGETQAVSRDAGAVR